VDKIELGLHGAKKLKTIILKDLKKSEKHA
jgi:hypothetical protein